MPQPYTAVPGGADASPPLGAPHTPPLGHAPPEFDSPGDDGDLGLPVAHSQQSRLSAFSSASAYAPLEGGQAAMPGRLPRPHSFASSHMLGAGSDYDSTYRLADFGRSTPGLSTPGEEHAMYEKGGAGAYAPVAAPLASDPRAAGRRRYGVAGQKGSARRRWCILLAVVLGLGIILVAVLVPLTQTLLKDDAPGSSGGSHGGGSNTGDQGTTVADGTGHGAGGRVLTEGGNGTVIELANGQSFTYINNFGGYWRSGLLDNSARAQSYTPALNESWDYAADQQMGVNLGGWLVLEPFIAPALFEPYENTSTPVVDEWTLSAQWRSEGKLEENFRRHYDTFITEEDFARIAGAGLNWVRLPIGFWAFGVEGDEPFLEGVAWEYFLKAVGWARKYGLRINADLHAVPGSQNSYNHSGRQGQLGWLNSPLGIVYAQRTINYLRTFVQAISTPEISPVVPMLSILNEPNLNIGIGQPALAAWNQEVYSMIRGNVTGTGAGHGPVITLHDGFIGLQAWNGYMRGADRVAYDVHPYIAFTPPYTTDVGSGALAIATCNNFQANIDASQAQNGITVAGEWSLALNDCGLFLNRVGAGVRYDGSYHVQGEDSPARTGDCAYWDDWESFSASQKASMRQTAIASMDALHNFYFWTWKIGSSLRTGKPVNPNWSYSLGLDNGWMPTDPRGESRNACRNLQSVFPAITRTGFQAWSSTYADYMTGAASTYAPATASYPWPPQNIVQSNTATMAVSGLPRLTPTGSIATAPTPTFSASVQHEAVPSVAAWANTADRVPMYTQIAGCDYGSSGQWPCAGSAPSRRSPSPAPAPTAAAARAHARDLAA